MTTTVHTNAIRSGAPADAAIGSLGRLVQTTPRFRWPVFHAASLVAVDWLPCSFAARRWQLSDIQAIVVQSLPLNAIGTSTARVGLLEATWLCCDSLVSETLSGATAVDIVNDLRTVLGGTSFLELTYDNITSDPFRSTATRMAELRALAPGLSLREWAAGLGVTKQAIKNWTVAEPRERPELNEAITALRAASIRHADVSSWLRSPLPGSERIPLDLVRDRRWRALRAATRLKPAIRSGALPTASMREAARKQREVSKQLGGADAPPAQDDEA
jgi:hypothetical protein